MPEATNKYAGDLKLLTSTTLKDTENLLLFNETEGERISVGDAVFYFAENMLAEDVVNSWTSILGEE